MIIKKFNELDSLNESFKDDCVGLTLPELMKFKSTYQGRVRDNLFDIICHEEKISEKDFNKIDYLGEYLEEYYTQNQDNVDEIIKEFEELGLRTQYCAEKIYSVYK